MANLLSGLVEQFGGPVLEDLGSKFGLPKETVKALTPVAVGVVMAGLSRVMKQSGGDKTVQGLLDAAGANKSLAGGDMAGFLKDFDPTKSEDMLKTLAGGNSVENIMGNLAGKAGISKDQATGLMSAVAPMVIGGLGKVGKEKGLDVNGLAEAVGGELKDLDMGQIDNFLDNTPGYVDDIQRGLKKLFG